MFYIPNLSCPTTVEAPCWELAGRFHLPAGVTDKNAITDWHKRPTTDHCYWSMYEGLNPSLRISEGDENPPVLMHGIIADFDFKGRNQETGALIASVLANVRPGYEPNYICRTFSGGARVVWVFSEALPLASKTVLLRFLKYVHKAFNIKGLLPGHDMQAWEAPQTYFEIGADWQVITGQPLAIETVRSCLFEAVKSLSRISDGPKKGANIPMSVVAEAMERRFPGRWQGPVEVNARGIRFWELGADNPTACVLKEDGVLCFTGDKQFLGWGEIFGPAFVKEWEEDRIAQAVANIYWDGLDYWKLNIVGQWENVNKDNLKLFLKTGRSLSSDSRPEVPSEIEEALHYIHEGQRIDQVAPLVHYPTGLVVVDGVRYLNISRIKPLLAVSSLAEVGEFEFIARLLTQLFDAETDGKPLNTFLTWLRCAYVGAIAQEPVIGQACFIAGPPECGKTLLSRRIVGQLLGGFTDASRFLLGQETFSSQVLQYPVWCVDDSAAASDTKTLATYSSNLKKFIVNRSHTFRDLFRKGVNTVWVGRIVVTCNMDAESLRILPDADNSILDKVHLFKVGMPAMKFPPTDEIERILARELPSFARWLLDGFSPPDDVTERNRYGHACYHDPELLEVVQEATPAGAFIQVLALFMKSWQSEEWSGSASELLTAINAHEELRILIKDLSTHRVGRLLSQLGKMDPEIHQKILRLPGHRVVSRNWVIPRSRFTTEPLTKAKK